MKQLSLAAAVTAFFLAASAWSAETPVVGSGTAPGTVQAVSGGNANWIALRGGVQVRFTGAGEEKAAAATARSLFANFVVKDAAVLRQPAKMIETADEIFGRFVIVTADHSGFTRAIVNVQRGEETKGGVTKPVFEDFVYVRGANTVWLRQAGNKPWKVAQDAKYEASPAQVLTVAGIGRIEIEATAEIYPPAGVRRAVGIDIRTDTSDKNQLQKYREIRAIWMAADRKALIQMGVDHVAIQNFTAKRLGRFQVRQMAYVQIQREAGKEWPDMPQIPPGAGSSKPPLTADAPAIDPEFLTAAIGRAFQVEPGGLADPLASAVAKLDVGASPAFAALLDGDAVMKGRVFRPDAGESVPVIPDRIRRTP